MNLIMQGKGHAAHHVELLFNTFTSILTVLGFAASNSCRYRKFTADILMLDESDAKLCHCYHWLAQQVLRFVPEIGGEHFCGWTWMQKNLVTVGVV